MRRFFVAFILIVTTLSLSVIALLASFFGRKGEYVHAVARIWALIYLRASGVRAVLTGSGNIPRPPYIFMCNHQSALDIYALQATFPLSFRWVAKKELFLIPFFGWALKRAGNISLDREHPREALKAMEAAARTIRGGTNIIMFPEGTRSIDGTLLPFKKGSFSIVYRAGVPVVPVGIRGTRELQPKGAFVAERKGTVYVHIGTPLSLEDQKRTSKEKLIGDVKEGIERLLLCQEN
jgi:1-acyl-sn-glycerol-3-phosphate acyltransferase